MTDNVIQFLPFKLARSLEQSDATEIAYHRDELAQAMADRLGMDLAVIALEGGPSLYEPFVDFPSDYSPDGAA